MIVSFRVLRIQLQIVVAAVSSLPAFEGVHKLPRCLQAFPHQHCLRAHDLQGILQQATLIFTGWRRRHCGIMERFEGLLWIVDV
jgi:hypothetical protein